MDRATRIKKLRYTSWYRGCKETDKILGGFARATLDTLSDSELDEFEAILAEDDKDVWKWISGELPMPERYQQSGVMQQIIAFDVSSLYDD